MTTETRPPDVEVRDLERVTIRFAGDSGDGMQLTGTQFTRTAAVFGNDISTLPDYPAEIRAPAGSLPGVSGFQISFSSTDIHTPGDEPDVLVAMNPAALKTNVGDLPAGGALIVNSDAFTQQNLQKAAYASNPLTDGSLKHVTLFEVPISTLNARALEGLEMTSKQVDLTKNFFALGLMFWLYERSMDPTLRWIDEKFSKRPVIAEANKRALKAGYAFGETTEIFHTHYRVAPAKLSPGTYRNITGNEATALGFLAASKLAHRPLFYGSYPITPASDILHQLSGYKNFGVKTFQAEDEIAAIGAAIGASYGGALGMTASSGPGIALKSEALGLAIMVELPLVVVDVQRAGPSTGMPTKNEQADLLQVMFGRNSDSPVPIVAPAHLAPGIYRNITGNEATALGMLAASKLAKRPLFYGSYPITPASDILHQLSGYKNFGVKTFQAEDEIAAIGAAIGASYGGALGMTASSGPGIALKSEALGLAIMVELPLVVVDVQRAGPSTGMPTKNEQADLLQVMFGRNSDSPVPIVAPATPGECFDYAIEAWRIALKYVTPVVYMSDAFLATGAEPWRVPTLADLPDIGVENWTDKATFQPYARDPKTLARMWAVPGTPGLEHRIGGLEKADISGNVSYDPDNHHRMQLLRAAKVAGIANDIPELVAHGPARGDLLILGWGSTYGAIRS
ncbi:MAG: 2-oxoacid:acceptor oxidoreductase family protein, partial [Chloroflexota bacterium]|nr:2-oxoacid:acceptor oxidoreductase family protein [Chloroflexota bacterium]